MFRETRDGKLKIFEMPKSGKAYSIGCDVAEGLAIGDDSTAVIIDTEMNHVASYCDKIAPDLFGEFLCRLGHWFNDALLTVEVNNHGILVIDRIKRKNYINTYQRIVEEIRGEEQQKRVGWQTNKKTKMKMINEFVAQYRDGHIKINDNDLLKEMSTLKIEDDGNVKLNGKDRIVAACLAIQGLPQVVTKGQFKASVPTKQDTREKDITSLSAEEKVRYYKTRRKEVSSFE